MIQIILYTYTYNNPLTTTHKIQQTKAHNIHENKKKCTKYLHTIYI